MLLALVVVAVIVFMTPKTENQRLTDEIDNTSSIQEDQVPPKKSVTDNTTSNLPSKDSGSSENFEPNPNTSTPSTAPEKPNILRAETTGTAVKVVAIFQNASDGYCEIAMTNGSYSLSRNAQIVVGPSYYSCSFSIPLAEFPSGSWTMVINHKIGTASSSSDETAIEVNQ